MCHEPRPAETSLDYLDLDEVRVCVCVCVCVWLRCVALPAPCFLPWPHVKPLELQRKTVSSLPWPIERDSVRTRIVSHGT